MGIKKFLKTRWKKILIILLILLAIGFISYAIGYQIGAKMVL